MPGQDLQQPELLGEPRLGEDLEAGRRHLRDELLGRWRVPPGSCQLASNISVSDEKPVLAGVCIAAIATLSRASGS